jgi:gliding motility-associated-like protein
MKKNLLICFFVLFTFQLRASDYYWVGGSGSWSDLNHWASVSGGVANKSIIPGTGDDVYFNANSGLGDGTVVTMPNLGNAVCRNMSWVGVTNAATFRNITTSSLLELHIYGNLELSASVKYGVVNMEFMSASNATYKTNGAVRLGATWYNQLTVNKPGGSLKLLDGIPATLGVGALTLQEGALDLSSNTHEINRLFGGGTATRTLNLTNTTLKATIEFYFNATNGTLLSTGSNIITDAFTSNGLSFSKVEVTGISGIPVITNTTFSELLFSNPNSIAGSVKLSAGNTVDRLEFKGGGRIEAGNNIINKLILAPSEGYVFREGIKINELFQFNTPDCEALGQITGGPAISLNFAPGAVVDLRNAFITNMVATGNVTPISLVGADGGGNTGFNIQPRATGTTLYWIGGAGNWDDKSHWAASSGGTGGACVPFTGDNVIFDSNSGFTAASKTVTAAGNAWCHNMTWTNVTNAPIFNTGTAVLEVYGNIELDPTLTISGTLFSKGSDESTFTTKGASLGTLLLKVEKTAGVGGLTLTDDINFPLLSIVHGRGKLIMANRNINMSVFNSSGNGRIIDISNSTITVADNWTVGASGATWVNNAAGSFITSNKAFTTNGLTYPKVYLSTNQNVVNITGTTITELVLTDTSPTSSVIALNGAGNNTIGTLDVRSGGVTFMGNNTITNLLLSPSRTYYFRNKQTINGLFRFNSPGCVGLGEMRGVDGTSPTIDFGPASTKDVNNIYVQNMTATGSGVPISVAGADAGGNTGFNITSSASGPRYWVGGSGDWNESAHWSTTSGGPGGACVPTVSNDVFFNANSFTAGNSAVTISQGNAYCRNMDWTGATNAPVFTKTTALTLEIWSNLVMNAAVRSDVAFSFTGGSNTNITSNGGGTGASQFIITKPAGSTVTLLDDFTNTAAYFFPRSGGIDFSNRIMSFNGLDNTGATGATSVNITGARITAAWRYQGGAKTLVATNSVIKARRFLVDVDTYNIVEATGTTGSDSYINTTTISDLLFSNPAASSAIFINSNNTIGRLEFRGKGTINGTGNTIETLIFSPGKMYTFLSGSTTTITKDWFGSGTPCNLTEINSSAAGAFTVNKTVGNVELDYVRLRNITAAGNTPFTALEHSENLGGNTNWSILPYNNTTPILGLGPDKTLCANGFPYTIKTDGFFASPMATFAWGDGSTGTTLVAAGPGTYTVTVSYPDGCSRTDNIVITKSDVIVAPLAGTPNVCVGATTNLSTTTIGGVWSSDNTAVATVSTTGVVTGVSAGTATIIYTVTNGNGCVGTAQQIVTVNTMPTVASTAGPNAVFAGDNITLTNATVGGVWSSSNTAVATVNASGIVTGVATGTVNIIYTVTGTGGCVANSTFAITVDAFDPAKRVLSITKTADAAEPSTYGDFAISLPAGINAIENITVSYTVTGTATAGNDYSALSGTATILTGQNSVAVSVNVINDAQIENLETVIASLSSATSTNYTYTINGTANSATVQITDDDDIPANRLLSISSQLNVNEPTNTGTFTIALPTGILAPENITVAYTVSGTAANGVDYETLTGTATILGGQNSVVINVKGIDDQIIEQTKTIILTLTGGTTTASGSFNINATNGEATLLQADDDYTAATKLLAVSSNGNAAEPSTNSSFTISLPTGYVSSLPITVTYVLTGTATYGVDYNSGSSTTVTLPAGQNSINVPINVTNDALIEPTETVTLTITNGVATQGATTIFTFSPDPTTPNANINITDDDNTVNNRRLSVTAQNGAEPGTNGSFTISLPTGILASENITVNYNLSGTATAGTDYKSIVAPVIIPAGQNSVDVPLTTLDDQVIEGTETAIITLTGGTSTNFSFTPAPAANTATSQIADDDATSNTTVVLLTKVSDAIEGSTNGQYRISLPPGITSSEDITISFNTSGTAVGPADYTLNGAMIAGNIVIPAGSNEVFVNVNAIADGIVEGPETVILNLTAANSTSTPYTIDPAGNGAVVTIVDVDAASSTTLEVTSAVNGTEPATNGSFTIRLAGGVTSAFPITVGYQLSGTAVAGLDYQNFGTITIPANQNSVTIPVQVLDDQIIENTETMIFTVLSGSAIDGGNAFTFPPDPVLNKVTVNIADNDASVVNQVLSVVKTADTAEPDQSGSFTISLPTGYTSSSNITLNYSLSGSATRNTDYTVSTITLPAYTNSVSIPVVVMDDQIIEGTETVILSLTGGTDGTFTYTAASGAAAATLNIADDDNTAANRVLSASSLANATEGGAAGSFNIKLPGSILATAPITVNYTVGGAATSVTDYAALTGTATILTGQNSVTIAVTAVDDNIIESTEAVTLTITGGTSTLGAYTAATGTETATLDIIDNDASVDAKRTLSIVRTAQAAEPASNGAFRIQLPTGISSSEDITVNYTIAGTATSGVDYTALSGTMVIPAGQNSAPLNVQVIDDYFMEPSETVIATLTNGASASFAFPITAVAAQKSTSLNIVDEDNTVANRVVTLTKLADAAEPSTNGKFRVSLPANILCPVNITVNYFTNGSTATSGTDFQPIGALVIPAGQNYLDVPIRVIDDKVIEVTEELKMGLSGTATGGFGFGISVNTIPVTLNITDDDDIPANRIVNVSAVRDGEEGGNSVRFNFSLPTGVISSEVVTINYTITGTAIKNVDYTPLSIAHFSGTATISAGTSGGTATVGNIVDDQIIEGTEDVTITINSVTSPSFTYTFGPAATANIIDNDNLPANLVLAATKTADAVEGGTNGEFTISLPGTTTTSTEAITVNYTLAGMAINGTDYTTLSGTVVIPAGDHDVKIPVSALTDQIIEGTENLILTITGGQSASYAFTPSATNASATMNITDSDNSPANLTLNITKLNDAVEPSTSGRLSIALPTGITANENININYTVAGTATPGTDYAALSGTATIQAGQNSVILPISVIDDQLIEPTETVALTLTGASSNSFTYTATGNVTLNIADDDNIPANLVLNVTKTTDAAEPGSNGNFNIALPAGITVPTDITVNYTLIGIAAVGKDYASLSGVVTIPAGNNSVDLPITVIDDQEVEGTESVTLAVTSGTSTGLVFTGGSSETINIADDDNIPANLVLTIIKANDAAEPTTDGSFSISLPSGVTVSEDITVNYTVAGTASAGTDYTTLSGTATILAGQNSVSVPVLIIDDQIMEVTKTVIATLTGATSANFSFSATGSATVNIIDDENSAANKVLTISKTADASEPASNGNFSISLPTGVIATENITVNYTVAGTAAAGIDYTALSGTVTIPAGQNAVNIPVLVIDDKVLEVTKTVIATLTNANSANFSFTATSSATLNITDDDNTAANKVLAINKTADAAEPASNGSFNISLPTGITATENITVNYTVGGTATAGTDYTPLSGTATILAGQNAVNVSLSVLDDNTFEPTETVILTLTGGTSANFSFAPSTINAVATANITDDDKIDQIITFTALPVKVLGDPSFILTATGGASGNPVIFTSSNPAIATISGNVVTIVGAGTVTITASQAGNALYNAAVNVSQVLTVASPLNTAPTMAAIANQQVCLTNAPQSISLSGISPGTELNQTATLSVSSTDPSLFSALSVTQVTGGNAVLNYTLNGSTVGITTTITVTVKDNGGTANGGVDNFSRTFTLTASPLPQLQLLSKQGTSVSKGQTVELTASGASSYTWATAAGIINGQTSATLNVRPAQTTTYTVTGTNATGCTSTSSITITVLEDYNLVGNNVMTPNGDGKNDFFVIKNIDMYPNNELRIFDRAGRAIYNKKGYNNEWDGSVNGKPLEENTYYYIIDLGNSVKPIKGFITIVRKY